MTSILNKQMYRHCRRGSRWVLVLLGLAVFVTACGRQSEPGRIAAPAVTAPTATSAEVTPGSTTVAAPLSSGTAGEAPTNSGRQPAVQESSPTAPAGTAAGGPRAAYGRLETTSAGGSPVLGNPAAPVTMVEYSDFQCPFCGRFARETLPTIVKKYVDTGVLKIEWRDFPYIGPESVRAAVAARAAQEEGKFWQYHDVLYHNQKSINSGAFSDQNLRKYAQQVGVSPANVERAFNSSGYEEVVRTNLNEGIQMGVTGTPTFIINGRVLVGAQPIEAFDTIIGEAAKRAGQK